MADDDFRPSPASFTGCFLDCTEPDPWTGLLFTVATLLMLAAPVAAWLLTEGGF